MFGFVIQYRKLLPIYKVAEVRCTKHRFADTIYEPLTVVTYV